MRDGKEGALSPFVFTNSCNFEKMKKTFDMDVGADSKFTNLNSLWKKLHSSLPILLQNNSSKQFTELNFLFKFPSNFTRLIQSNFCMYACQTSGQFHYLCAVSVRNFKTRPLQRILLIV